MALEMAMGLRNSATGKYLTQETFGFAMNCNGKSLKKKQSLTMVVSDGTVHFKTHMNKFLYGDRDGKVNADADSMSADTAWTIVPQPDGTWGLKSAHQFYIHGAGDKLTAFVGGDEPPADGRWVVHLAMHPQINLYSAARKRFIHLKNGELQCNEDVPWGDDALLSLVFFDDHPHGRYGLIAANGQYLESSGKLVDSPTPGCYFLIGFHDDQVSFCDDSDASFLSCVGGNGVLKKNKNKVTKDELFKIQDSEPQFTIRNLTKDMAVSARNGTEVKADVKLNDIQDSERFQFEVKAGGLVHVMTDKLKYWVPRSDNSIGAEADKQGANTAFRVDYSAGNTVRFVHESTGKVLWSKPNGALMATGDGSEESGTFEVAIINRPTLILRGQYGFVGLKGASGRVECNRTSGDVFTLESKGGEYYLSMDGRYWTVDADGVAATSSSPVAFFLEFVEPSKCMIKHKESGYYLKGEQNGGFKAVGSAKEVDTLWEF
eukprot:m.62955 g.62955  ORF g.62955 m.62955 type:complete len:489 (+) comp13943_c0_seq1:114-1580(+)